MISEKIGLQYFVYKYNFCSGSQSRTLSSKNPCKHFERTQLTPRPRPATDDSSTPSNDQKRFSDEICPKLYQAVQTCLVRLSLFDVIPTVSQQPVHVNLQTFLLKEAQPYRHRVKSIWHPSPSTLPPPPKKKIRMLAL
jgi:hypothetical protein